ncbi:MAG: hypothetical protein HZB46_14215, partial [Solirubrobacterales bacterium]|nr:hypothetical protein [Solirubrobacterales bacterium]
MRILAVTVVALLALAAPASAGERIDRAVRALQQDPVYAEADAQPGLSDAGAAALRDRIRAADAGPFYIAVLGGAARDEAGGDPSEVLRQVIDAMGQRPGTYA